MLSSVTHWRPPRWISLLVPSVLVAALLVLHGIDAGATETTMAHSPAEASHPHEHSTPDSRDGVHCEHCTAGHLIAACAAVVTTVVALRHRRSTTVGPVRNRTVPLTLGWLGFLRELIRPPEPPWVRLGVMLR